MYFAFFKKLAKKIVPILVILIIYTIIIIQFFSSSSTNSNLKENFNQIDLEFHKNFENFSSNFGEKNVLQLSSHMENIPPLDFILNTKKFKNNCGKFPSILDIKFNNLYWQKQKMGLNENLTAYLYNAYLDTREKSAKVRILAMIDDIKIEDKISGGFCQFWVGNGKKLVTSMVEEYRMIWYGPWGNFKTGSLIPYLITCPLRRQIFNAIKDSNEIVSVSLTQNSCQNATNNLRIHYDQNLENGANVKKGFAVCVKGMDFTDDLSIRLVEWIEILDILGADKIIFYEFQNHPNMTKVLDYYQSQNKIEVHQLTLPADLPNENNLRHYFLKNKVVEKRQVELIPYNDCFYKNIYKYEFITLLDIDEVIVPIVDLNWADLMKNLKSRGNSSYHVQNIYFFDDDKEIIDFGNIPKHLHILRHVKRTANILGGKKYVKSFFSTDQVLTLHNHYPLACIYRKNHFCSYSSEPIGPNLAQLQHYRSDCVKSIKNCGEMHENTIKDTNIWRYKSELIDRTNRVYSKLKLI